MFAYYAFYSRSTKAEVLMSLLGFTIIAFTSAEQERMGKGRNPPRLSVFRREWEGIRRILLGVGDRRKTDGWIQCDRSWRLKTGFQGLTKPMIICIPACFHTNFFKMCSFLLSRKDLFLSLYASCHLSTLIWYFILAYPPCKYCNVFLCPGLNFKLLNRCL